MLQYFVTMCHSQGRRNSGRAGEAVKELRAVETYKKSLPICLFMFSNNVDLKNINTNYIKSF